MDELTLKLVIAEKPSVGKAIAAVLNANKRRDGFFEGNNYIVSWCIGHLLQLAPPDAYSYADTIMYTIDNGHEDELKGELYSGVNCQVKKTYKYQNGSESFNLRQNRRNYIRLPA